MGAQSDEMQVPAARCEVRVEELSGHLKRVQSILLHRRIDAGQAWEAICQGLSASCVQCGIMVTGPELARIAGRQENGPEPAKLARIIQGYCARNGCDSHFYSLCFRQSGEIKWNEVWNEIRENPQEEPAEAEADNSISMTQALVREYGAGKLAWTAVILIFAMAMLCWHFRTPSWSSRSPGFQVDVSTLPQMDRVVEY